MTVHVSWVVESEQEMHPVCVSSAASVVVIVSLVVVAVVAVSVAVVVPPLSVDFESVC